MRMDTLLKRFNYELPADWCSLSQKELKESMLAHMETHAPIDVLSTYLHMMATYTDSQFGNMCVRLAKLIPE